MQTVRDVTYQLLRDAGLTSVFGNPGSTEETFLKNFPSDFRYVLALQEASVIAMADGFAQATGRPALVNVHTGAGVGNAMGNLITASLNKTPLIVTAGQQTREMLLMEPWLTNVEATILPRPWAKWAYEPVRAEDVPGAFMRAIATALQPPQGPVFLSLPLDDWERPCAGPAVVRTVSHRIAPDGARLAEFAKALSDASSPVLIFGAAIDRGHGWKQAVAFAEALGAPVWAAPASERAPFPENHPLYCGGLPFAIAPLCKKLEGHDVALVVGAPVFRYYPYVPGRYLPDGMRLLHISDDPGETARAPVGDSLLGDAVLSVAALTDLLPRSKPRARKTPEKVEQRMAPHPASQAKDSDDGRLTAAQVFGVLNDIRPADAILVEESPSNLPDLHKAWPITEPASFFTMASGGLGFGLPASIGIALAERETGRNRPVIAVIGDGSFQYSVQSLWTAAQHHLPILFMVLRNSEYAILKSFAELEETQNVPGLDLPGLDIVALAKGFGCEAARVDRLDAIKRVAAEAWTRPGPTVLEIPISSQIPRLI
ncbi:MAG TPA: benzoylformate decarboxylase [Rhizomicrobium sp.]|jgi:benzoylformate decarboxylase|nr:benzoylformate decarboxylase [Rhizomicrobium sp.]